MRRAASVLLLGATVLAVPACARLDEAAPAPALDLDHFRCRVQPILVKSCSAFACHGDVARFYRVFGRNRLRYGLPSESRNLPLEPGELAFNYESAVAYADVTAPSESNLLQKPLDESAGGYYHGGAVEYGLGDVWLTRDDEDYQTVLAWVGGAKEEASCIAPGE
jgi:hypothetical protein